MKRAFIATLILLLTQVGWSSPSNLDRILETGVLVVGTTADYRPFTYREQGELRGYDIDLARLIAAELQVEIEFRPTSWSRLVPDLQEKKFQLAVGGITRTLPRQTRAGFTDPVLTIGKCPLVRQEDVHRFRSMELIDQPGVTIAVNPGGTNEKFVTDNVTRAKIVVLEDNLAIPQAVADGRADVMLTDNVEALMAAEKDPRLAAVSADKPWTVESLALMTDRDDQAFLNWLNLFLSQAEADGRLSELRKKHGL